MSIAQNCLKYALLCANLDLEWAVQIGRYPTIVSLNLRWQIAHSSTQVHYKPKIQILSYSGDLELYFV